MSELADRVADERDLEILYDIEPYTKEEQLARPWGRASKTATQLRKAKSAAQERSGDACEARCPGVCTGRGEQFHHKLRRSQGGSDTAENGLLVCGACHTFIHANPKIAYANGWLIRSTSTEQKGQS